MGFVTRSTNAQQQNPLSLLDGENANDVSVSEVVSPHVQFPGIERKRKLETNYDIENKVSSRD